MTTPLSYAPPAPCQGDWRRTWQRNANYRHGRYCRYRLRLEWRLAHAQRRVRSYLAEAPRFAPYVQQELWPTLPAGVLPRRLWRAAVKVCQDARFVLGWFRLWKLKQQAGYEGPAGLVYATISAYLAGSPLGASPRAP